MQSFPGYKSIEKIHVGFYADIYRVVSLANEKNFIIKTTHNENPSNQEIAALHHEYQLLKQLNFPGIVRVENIIKCNNTWAIVLEDVESISLHQYFETHTLSLASFLIIANQLIDIIGTLH